MPDTYPFLDLTTLPLVELLTTDLTPLDEVMRRVVEAAEDESSLTCAFNSAI